MRRARARGPRGQPECRSQYRGRPGRAGRRRIRARERLPALRGTPAGRLGGDRRRLRRAPRERPPPPRAREPPLAGTASAPARTWWICPRASAGFGSSRPEPHAARSGSRATGSTWTAVLAVEGSAFALLELDDKERRLARWGGGARGLRPARQPGQPHRLDRSHRDPARRRARALPARRPEPAVLPPGRCAPTSSCSTRPGRPRASTRPSSPSRSTPGAHRAPSAARAGGDDGGGGGAAARAGRPRRASPARRGRRARRAQPAPARPGDSPRLLPRRPPGLDRRGAGDPELAGTASCQRRADGGRGVAGATTAATGPFTAPTGSPSGPASRSARTSSCRSSSRARRGARSRW